MFVGRTFRLSFVALALFVASHAVAQDAPAPAGTPPADAAPPAGVAPPSELTPPPEVPSPPEEAAPQDQIVAPVQAAPEIPAPSEPTARCIVVDAAVYGISAVVGEHVTAEMRTTATALGYATLTRDETVATAQSSHMPYPPTPADLWRTTWAAHASRGAFARVWAAQGRYVIEITVASADGGGPFFARGTSGAQDLHQVVAALTRQALPPPGVSTPAGTTNALGFGAQAQEAATPAAAAPARPARRRTGRAMRWVIAVQTESAFGTSSDFFYNHLFGARLDYRITPDLRIGAYLGYANLRGRDGRAGNMLMYAQLEDRVRVTPTSQLRVPLRLGIGYLPYNGPVIRLAAGLAIPLSRRVDLVFDILAPTIWLIPDRTLVSLDIAAELSLKF